MHSRIQRLTSDCPHPRRCVLLAGERVPDTELARIQRRDLFCEPGEGPVGRALRDPRGVDFCANIDDLDDATLPNTTEHRTRPKHIVCCRVEGGVVEMGTTKNLCSIHISGTCRCALLPTRRLTRNDSPADARRHSPLRMGVTSARAQQRNKMAEDLDNLLGLFDQWGTRALGTPPPSPGARGTPPPSLGARTRVATGESATQGTAVNASEVWKIRGASSLRSNTFTLGSTTIRGETQGRMRKRANSFSKHSHRQLRPVMTASPAPALQETRVRRTRRASYDDARFEREGKSLFGGQRRLSEDSSNFSESSFAVVAKFQSVNHFIRDTQELFGKVRWKHAQALEKDTSAASII